ncbi:InlB B-repeat-containing protein [Fodinibius halophilus]|uniref:Bacterial repeat domain-containing protein n=1 Tax=Fodinibius halophilus TaxID=1736908 RepID=A0A6M1T8N9_9BACT|nr:hypothetical protein [Fodinibius halophilus]NGP88933.1 hypothetical protein [Fodinibius halophilus]
MRFFALLFILAFLAASCSDGGLGYNDPLYDMKSSVNPQGEGEVNPPFGTYVEGKTITIEAVDIQPADTMQFLNWTGDTTATDNPLTFEISRDMNLVANYGVPDYIFRLLVADGVNPRMDLVFGMEEGATDGFDEGVDRELPPSPPDNGFDARLSIPSYGLAEDYRSFDKDSLGWQLDMQSELANDVTLKWDYSDKTYFNRIRLTDSPNESTFTVDMKTNSFYTVTEDTKTTLYIIGIR